MPKGTVEVTYRDKVTKEIFEGVDSFVVCNIFFVIAQPDLARNTYIRNREVYKIVVTNVSDQDFSRLGVPDAETT